MKNTFPAMLLLSFVYGAANYLYTRVITQVIVNLVYDALDLVDRAGQITWPRP